MRRGRKRGRKGIQARTARHHLTSSGRRGMSVTRMSNDLERWLRADRSPVRFIAPRKRRRGSGFTRTLRRQGLI